MTRETKFKSALVMNLLIIITITFFYFKQQDELRKCKEGGDFIQGGDIEKQVLINERDSLQTELFVMGTQLTRYEVAFEMFKEKNRTGSEEFDLILTTQTE